MSRYFSPWLPPALLLASLLLPACGGEPLAEALPEPRELISRSAVLMGTPIELLVVAAPGPETERVLDAAVARIAAIEDRFTTWERPSPRRLGKGVAFETPGPPGGAPESDLLRLNRAAGQPVEVSQEVLWVLERAKAVCRLTEGAFDPTVAGSDRVWDFHSRPVRRPPSRAAARRAMRHVDCASLHLDPSTRTARLDPYMSVGLGGMVKGYAADEAARVLRLHGVTDFIVNAGGDLLASGRYREKLWQVGIRHPRKRGKELAILPVSGYAVATSGDYERYVEYDGQRFHHILDPRTGYPATGSQSVSVLAPSGLEADALATGVFVLGPKRGLALIESLPHTEALIVDSSGALHVSSGLRQ